MKKIEGQFLSEAVLFYMHAGLFAFAEIIFLLSLPILFWERGFSLSFIFAFYAFTALPGYFLTRFFVQSFLKTSIKKMLMIGLCFYILLGAVIPLIQIGNSWWILAFFLLTFQSLFYFPARYLYFSEIISHKSIGIQTAVLNATIMIARTIGPIVGGFLFVFAGFNVVFVSGGILMFLSLIPVLLMQTKFERKFDFLEFKAVLATHDAFKTTKSAYIADGMNGIVSYLLWPLLFFLFISQNNYFELSSLMTISYGASALIMLAVGHFFDRKYRKILLRISIFSNILASLARFLLLFFNPLYFVYLVQSFYTFSESALQSTFEAYRYGYSKNTNTIFFTIHREINYALGRFVSGLFLALFCLVFTDLESLWYLFLLTIPIVLIYFKTLESDSIIA